MSVIETSEQAHRDALAAYRRATRAGDLAKAERWLRCAERHYRLIEHARRDAAERKARRLKVDRILADAAHRAEEERAFARQVRAARHRKRLAAIARDDG
jgi:hypothetical protein